MSYISFVPKHNLLHLMSQIEFNKDNEFVGFIFDQSLLKDMVSDTSVYANNNDWQKSR